jgi:signal transduction histidine kinase
LAAPLLPLLVLTALEVRDIANEVSRVRDETRLASSATGPTGIVTQLQNERTWASLAMTGLEATMDVEVAGFDETRGATDAAIADFRADIEAEGGAVEAAYSDALDSLGAIDEIRDQLDADTGPKSLENMPFSTEMYDRYTELIQGLLDANSSIALQVQDTELRKGTELFDIASRQYEVSANLTREVVVDANISPDGLDTRGEISASSQLLARFDRNTRDLLRASAPYDEVIDQHHPTPFAETLHDRMSEVIESGRIVGDVNQWLLETTPRAGEGYPPLQNALLDRVVQRADQLDSDATSRQRLFLSLAGGALILATGLTLLISRSITRPLHSLTGQAIEMASGRLPEAVRGILATPLGTDVKVPETTPLTVTSRDEIADVTEALNTAQESALGLAVEQAILRHNIADSFVNLGRRNQNLLGRQLDFITELETNESDPDTLASLFQLDHLATRMRRNAESLLVLAGIEPSRRWSAPVRVSDVIRAALGEVENYERVQIEPIEPAPIVGSAAADVAHLLAELIENAIAFSPPDTAVVVRGRWREPDGYRLTIIDQGIGMSADGVTQANVRLAGSESFTVAPSKYLGHYVAGNLAARHDIRVQVVSQSGRGTVAGVDLPFELIAIEAQSIPEQLGRPAAAQTWEVAQGALPPSQGEGGGGPSGSGGWPAPPALPPRPQPRPQPQPQPQSQPTAPAAPAAGEPGSPGSWPAQPAQQPAQPEQPAAPVPGGGTSANGWPALPRRRNGANPAPAQAGPGGPSRPPGG